VLLQKRNQRHEKARRAEAALEGVGFVKGLLQGMKLVGVAQGFDGPELPPVSLNREHQAGAHRLVIEENGARATDPVLAANPGPGKTELVTQEIREEQPGLDAPLVPDPVDHDTNGVLPVHAQSPEVSIRMAEPGGTGCGHEAGAGVGKRVNDTPEAELRKSHARPMQTGPLAPTSMESRYRFHSPAASQEGAISPMPANPSPPGMDPASPQRPVQPDRLHQVLPLLPHQRQLSVEE